MIYIFSPEGKNFVFWNWMQCIGKDTPDFLQRLSTIHIPHLTIGTGKEGFFLTPNAKIKIFFTLWRFSQTEFGFEFDGGYNNERKTFLNEWIEHYTFGEEIMLQSISSSWVWIFDTSPLPFPWILPMHTLSIQEKLRAFHHSSHAFGQPWVTLWGPKKEIEKWIHSFFPAFSLLSEEELEKWRIQALYPRVSYEFHKEATPFELGLDHVIASHKGCYPGQEVIEKMRSFNAAPRILVQIQSEGAIAPHPGEKIFNYLHPEHKIGKITSCISIAKSQFLMLGLIRKQYSQENLKVQFQNPPIQGTIKKIIYPN